MNFLASPEMVIAMSFSGDLRFNPITDSLLDSNNQPFHFQPPSRLELPPLHFTSSTLRANPTTTHTPTSNIQIAPTSQRLQRLAPFDPWSGKELESMAVLVKVKGKCTTDHISAAGSWLRFKGHLENLSNNTLIGAVNSINDRVNWAVNVLAGEDGHSTTIPYVARSYKKARQSWAVIGDENYGEGSAREHAALQPRYLGCQMILSKSFARIHETNLKKQGVLPLTFLHPEEYNRIPASDLSMRLSTVGLVALMDSTAHTPTAQKVPLMVRVWSITKNFEPFDIPVLHTLSSDQMEWFRHGSALNMIRKSKPPSQSHPTAPSTDSVTF